MSFVNNQYTIVPKSCTLPSEEEVKNMIRSHNLLAEVAGNHIANIQSTIDKVAFLFKLNDFFADKNILYSLNYLLKNLSKKDSSDSSSLYESFLALIDDVKLNAITLHLEIAEHIMNLNGLQTYIETLPRSSILDLVLKHTQNQKETLEGLDYILVGETPSIEHNAENDASHMDISDIT